MNKELKSAISGFYDVQKLRIAIGNRLARALRASFDDEPDTLLARAIKEYKDHLEGLKSAKVILDNAKYINKQPIFALAQQYVRLLDTEDTSAKTIEKIVKQHPLWDAFLKDVQGCGPLLAATLIAKLDPYKAPRPSNFVKYAGLDPAPDGKARSRRKEHLVDREYTDRDGNIQVKKSLSYDPWLRVKLFLLGTSFLKSKSPYTNYYYARRHLCEHHAEKKNWTDKHKHLYAMRHMVRKFLIDLWVAWRELEGLPIVEPYEVEKLGRVHHGYNDEELRKAAEDWKSYYAAKKKSTKEVTDVA